MIKLRTFTVNPLGVNCYVLSDETREGVIVDCGTFGDEVIGFAALHSKEFAQIRHYIEAEGITLKHNLLTHTHFDHIMGVDNVYDTYGLQPECHNQEREIWAMNPEMTRGFCGFPLPLPKATPTFALRNCQSITFGNTTLRVIHTPGHTPGGVCYYCEAEGILLSGDTLFQYSVGRTDLPLGNMAQEIQSIRNSLCTLPPQTKVYPGHGDPTSIAEELDNNPYLM